MFHICLQLGLTAIIAYLIGSIPTGYLIVKAKTGKDKDSRFRLNRSNKCKKGAGKKLFFPCYAS